MEFIAEIGLFLVKALIIVGACLLVIGGIARAASRGDGARGRLKVAKLNDRYRKLALEMKRAMLPKGAAKAAYKAEKARMKAERKAAAAKTDATGALALARPRVFVVDFEGNLRATRVDSLRRELTAILSVATPNDEVFVRLQSPGGFVHAYGLAASQLERVKERRVRLVVAVDMVAASGGYMMACVADRILAAPFAIVGSIGVITGVPNVHRLLKKHDVDFELLTAGEFKRTLTVFGENTDKARRKMQEEIDETHRLFKAHVARHRPALDIDRVATGEHWYGTQAVELGLVDGLSTSDDYLMAQTQRADVLSVNYEPRKRLMDRFGIAAAGAARGVVDRMVEADREARLL